MIRLADRKESSKIIQFRAPSEYHCIIELITKALNEKYLKSDLRKRL